MWDKLEAIERRYHELEARWRGRRSLATTTACSRLPASMPRSRKIVGILNEYRVLRESLDQARAILDDGSDADLVSLARDELERDEVKLELARGEAAACPRTQGPLRRKGRHRRDPRRRRRRRSIALRRRPLSACTAASPSATAGTSRSSTPTRATSAASRRSSSRWRAAAPTAA